MATEDPSTELDASTSPRRLVARVALFAGVLVVGALALLTLPGVGEVRERLRSADPAWLVVAGACGLASMLGFVRALWAAFDRLVPWRRAVVLGFAEQGANVLLPAGGVSGPALGALVMQRAGVPRTLAVQRHAVLFLATSAVSFAGLVVFGLLTGIGLLAHGDAGRAGLLVPALGGALVLGVAVAFARRPAPREPAASRRVRHTVWLAHDFIADGSGATLALLRRGDRFLILGSISYYAFDIATLAAAFRAFGGGGPPLGVFVLAYTLGHAGALLPTPGGVGGTEGGLIGMFVAYGAPLEAATAAVLGYRVFQLGLPALLGGVAMLRIRSRLAAGTIAKEVSAARPDAARELP